MRCSSAPSTSATRPGIDFTHAAVGIFGRLTAIAVGVVALRRTSSAGARRVGAAAVGVLAVVVLVASVATLATTGDEAQPSDVVITITDFDFAETIDVTVGDTLFVDNQEPFRHTFTAAGTSLDFEVPASQGARIAIDAEPGVYDVISVVPGHEAMQGLLSVR